MTSSKRLQDMSSRHLRDMSSRHLQDMSSRRLQEGEQLLRRRRVADVFKTCLEDVLKRSSRPTNVCWEAASAKFGGR